LLEADFEHGRLNLRTRHGKVRAMNGIASDQYYYRVVLAIIAAAVLACVFTIFTATAEPIQVSDGTLTSRCSERG
jgi:hypothetical protein